jgi:hypothetical protein
LLHWNGTSWTSYPYHDGLTLDPGQIAVVGRQVWRIDRATIDGRPDRLLIRRWTGAAWQTVSSPHPGIGSRVEPYLSASSPRNVWVDLSHVRGEAATLLHWNGTAWSELQSPAGWLVTTPGAAAMGKASVWIDAGFVLWSDGKWQAAGGSCGNPTAVPGTDSALCAGGVQPGTGPRSYGVISQNGPLP